ncbi:RE1 [Symbiodinium microadriaticum]|nr:RE1 [Symbiodinium microadriaticum]
MGDKDPFRDLTFTGSPSEYRLFRRKILLSVASLEEKHVHLAGPRILSRLSGEAWRATEHLSIGDVRSEKGWLCVLRALDDHYRYLPETELNECVDEFLFHLKRRAHEGPTAFVSRFKAVLNRLESLVASEKAAQKGSTKRRRAANKKDSSSSGSSSDSFGSGPAADEPRLTKEKVEAASSAAPAATTRTTEGPAPDSKGPRTVGSFVESPKKKPPSSGGGSHYSRGTHKADEDKAQRRMLENLGKLEAGHLRVRPIFPEVILGHLFMRKYGLTREQRSQVIRSTGGSCRFKDVEKVIRASDYEDKTADPHGRGSAPRANRSGNVMAAEEDSSLSEPSLSGDEVCEAEDESADTEDREELEEAYEVQKKAKQDAKKAYRNYKDSRKRVREIKKDRQPYMPVVAIPPPTSAPLPGDGQPIQPTFKYDRKTGRMDKAKGGGKRGRREDVSLVQSELVTEFSYMVTTEDADEHDVYSVTVPAGLAVIDTGCTTSVIGEETAARYTEYFRNRGLPEPVAVTLPPVQLKGFNGLRTATERGLRWTVKLGSLWGQITTYMVEGSAPFLLSRKVLQGMEATLDLGKCTLTSAKHGLHDEPLAQAGNGHLLLPLVPPDEAEDLLAVGDCPPVAYPCAPPDPKSALATPEIPTDDQTSPKEVTNSDLRRYFQTIMKHTRYSQVDVGTHRFERMPKQAASHHMYARVAHLRAAFDRPGACIFAYRYERSKIASQVEAVRKQASLLKKRVGLIEVFAGSANVLARRKKERPFLHLFEQAWSLQTMLGGHIHAENPVASLAWNEMSLGPAYEVDFDLCAVGLVDKSSGMPIQRPTRVVTSDPQLVSALRVCQCPGHSAHAHVADSAQSPSLTYPRQFCRNIATALACRDTDVTPDHDIFVQTDDEADSERESDQEGDPDEAPRMREANRRSYAAMIQKLHVNTGHASVPQMLRLAQQAKAPAALVAEIRKFRCPVCEELQVPPSHRVAALRHTETPNHIVGLDVVQVELKRDGPEGVIETKYNVLTAVDYASDFSQQIVLPAGPGVVSKAFHAMWCRPYGPPRVIYVDPDQRWMSGEFQEYLKHNSITLLDCAAESHWQLGRVEVAQRILRNMAQRVWRTTQRPAEEVIESCCAVRNEQLKRHGFSSAQWFLGRDPRVPGSLSDLTEQKNVAVQDAVLSERDFAQKMQVRQQAAEAFIGAHAHDAWTRAIKGRSRPIRGPYVVGQSVYVFRRQGRGQLNTRHGAWLGPGRVVGTESFREDSPIPRVIWVVVNGFMYKCSPECLRPVAEDEVAFRHAAQEFHTGRLAEELEQATPSRRGPAGRFFDLTREPPSPEDFLTPPASDVEGEDNLENSREETTRNVRRRVTISDAEWERRAAQTSPRGGATIRNREEADPTAVDVEHPADKAPRLSPEDLASDLDLEMYVPSPAEEQFPEILGPDAGAAPSAAAGEPLDNPAQEPLPSDAVLCCEVALDIFDVDLDPQGNGLWKALEECAVVAARPGQKRRVEVSFRKLGPEDREKFRGAMKKEWQSWLENKVTTIAKGKGVPKSRIIGSRWVLTWKKSSDPDDRTLSAKARLVLVGFQDPDLGRIAIDSPTLRKESKHVILSICASKGWVIWGADIKTAFLSGDQSDRQLYFRPPPEVRELMNLSDDDVLRLNKAAYGLAEAPRAWFLRLTRELLAVGLTVSQLDPCVFCLRDNGTNELVGICGVHVDDLLGGGTSVMDQCLVRLKIKLPFGEFRQRTIKYTGAEIRQHPDFSIEVTQEAYVDKLEEVSTKPFGKASDFLNEPTLMRACCGQLAWVANHSRPDQTFLASYLQGIQDKALVSHLDLYNKAVREMKARKVSLRFPPVPVDRWRLLAITDAGWGVRANGESQGGLLLCLCDKDVLEQKPGKTWIIEWSSKKLRRVVRSSTAAETLAAQNGLDSIEFAQAFLQEVLFGMSPRQFQQWVPETQSGLVIDSKSLYDALTRSACSSALAMEKRLAIDYAIARACLAERNVLPFWTNNLQMISDCLTKLRGNKEILYKVLDTCTFHVRPSKESGRKETARKKGDRPS